MPTLLATNFVFHPVHTSVPSRSKYTVHACQATPAPVTTSNTTIMTTRKIYIARHGERLDFVDPNWYSNAENPHDPPLTDRGRGQATDLGRKLMHANIKHVYTSPFSRCVNTAVNAAAAISPDLKINVEPGACEWLNSDWYADSENGPIWLSAEDLKTEFPTVSTDYTSILPMTYNFDAFPETEQELSFRCMKMVRGILDTAEGDDNILIIGHGSSVEALYSGLVPGIRYKVVTYCCLTECIPTDVPMKYTVGLHCDTSFLTHPEDEDDTRYI